MLGCVFCTWILCYTTRCAMSFSLIPFKNQEFPFLTFAIFYTSPVIEGFHETGNSAQNSTRRNWMLLSSGMRHRAVYGRSVPTFHSLYCFLRQGCMKCFGKCRYFSTRLQVGLMFQTAFFIVLQWEPEISTRKLAEAVTHLTRIREVSNSNLGWDTAYPDRVFLNLSRYARIIH